LKKNTEILTYGQNDGLCGVDGAKKSRQSGGFSVDG
jgi:hypothetical protein